MNHDNPDLLEMSVAVVGMAGRFPGARNVNELWQNLLAGKHSITIAGCAADRGPGEVAPQPEAGSFVDAGGVLDDIEMFDAEFFGFTPREAQLTDPQHRLLLECAHAALEDAGQPPGSGRTIGVFVGSSPNDYLHRTLQYAPALLGRVDPMTVHIANSTDFIATKLSYKLNLQGPGITVSTACSTSLVAVHLAWKSLLSHETDVALAGGVSVRLPQTGHYYHPGGINSPDGHCRPFDVNARGIVRGNGVGIVVLKRLEDALSDGDCIDAVIRGSAINNDGAEKVGYTAPSVAGQARVIAEALAIGEIDAASIGYLECHGTGTPLGDPLEIAALKEVLGRAPTGNRCCMIGSIKANIGHLDAAAGIASLIKVVLALKHRRLPPAVNFSQPNPRLDLQDSCLRVSTVASEWHEPSGPRRAGVSSFGIGGTNAHVVLQEYVPPQRSSTGRKPQVLTISAKTAAALNAACVNLRAFLGSNPGAELADVAYTLQLGREQYPYRCAFVCDTVAQATEKLLHAEIGSGWRESLTKPSVVFMFPGQGAEHVGMTRALHRSEAAFRQTLDECVELLAGHIELDLRDIIYPEPSRLQWAQQMLQSAQIAQPALFVVEYSLARLWMSWGISPAAMIGHGLGEYVAACLAGVFPLEASLQMVVERGKLLQRTSAGATLAAALPEPAMHGFEQLRTQANCQGGSTCVPKDTNTILLEVGVGQTLMQTVRERDTAGPVAAIPSLGGGKNLDEDAIAKLQSALGKLWSMGVQVDWRAVHAQSRPVKIRLPHYPLQLQRFWVDADFPQGHHDMLLQSAAMPADTGAQIYRPVWDYTQSSGGSVAAVAPDDWLVFADGDFGAQLVRELRCTARRCYEVRMGAAYSRLDAQTWQIDPACADDYLRLVGETGAAQAAISRIVHGWNLANVPQDQGQRARIDSALRTGFQSLLHLARALQDCPAGRPVHLWILSSGAQGVTSAETVYPERATLTGPCLVIPQEYAHLRCKHIDFAQLPGGVCHDALWIRHLLDELAHGDMGGTVLYRGAQRWVRSYAPMHIAAHEERHKLRAQGVYLITGGTGRIGVELAEYLASKVQARIALLCRSDFPAREAWPAWLQGHAVDDPISAKIRRLQSMEHAGAQLLILKADVADAAGMSAAIAQTVQRYGRLHGVFHLAADLTDAPLSLIADDTPGQGGGHFRSKVFGLCVLEQSLAKHELDFCMLFSSLSAVLGGIGHAAYSAANSYMDVFANSAPARGVSIPYVSVCWDGWQFDAAGQSQIPGTLISPPEGMRIVDRLLSCALPAHVCVSKTALAARIGKWVQGRAGVEHASREPATFPGRASRTKPYVAPRSEMDQQIAGMWQELLGIAEIGIDDDFFELGGDSLTAARLSSRISSHFAVEAALSVVFDGPTIRQMAAAISTDLLAATDAATLSSVLTEIREGSAR